MTNLQRDCSPVQQSEVHSRTKFWLLVVAVRLAVKQVIRLDTTASPMLDRPLSQDQSNPQKS